MIRPGVDVRKDNIALRSGPASTVTSLVTKVVKSVSFLHIIFADEIISDYHTCEPGSTFNSMKCSSLIRVGDTLLGISDAIGKLSPGEVLELPPGYYTGSRNCGIVIGEDNVVIRSSMGLGTVVIDCNLRSRHFDITGDNVSLEFLSLIRGAPMYKILQRPRIQMAAASLSWAAM